jgi:hypothetical protein
MWKWIAAIGAALAGALRALRSLKDLFKWDLWP